MENKSLSACRWPATFLIGLGITVGLVEVKTALAQASFQGLGHLSPDGFVYSNAWGVSADGSVVAGTSSSPLGEQAFRWKQSTGMVGLGILAGDAGSTATAISADGTVVVGLSHFGPQSRRAFRWTQATGLVSLGFIPGGSYSVATGVSANGSVVVGHGSSPSGQEAFRWTAGNGMIGLGDLPGNGFESGANGVSANGLVVVGNSASANGYESFQWTQAAGIQGIGDLPGGVFQGNAFAASADGAVIVGGGFSSNGFEAYRWTSADGLVALGDLPGGTFDSRANAVSADGSIVVGHANFDSSAQPNSEAFVWDAVHGMRSVREVLVESGLNLSGWALLEVTGVSADGRTLVGRGTNPAGQSEAWIARLPTCAGDMDGNGAIDGLDIRLVVPCLVAGSINGDCACADIDSNQILNPTDVNLFVQTLLAP